MKPGIVLAFFIGLLTSLVRTYLLLSLYE